jgi:integrase
MRRNTIGQREGAAPEVVARLMEVISPLSPDNPWNSDHVKTRNQLIFHWMLGLGVRRGELLNIKISDIDFRREEVTIARRADDAADPRRDQPKVKTRDRKLPLSPALCQMAHDYVTKVRCKINGSRKHEFLLVADKTGGPMSLSSLNKAFVYLRENCSGLPDNLEPHVLRHTWNDAFSERMDKAGTTEAEEQQMRSFLMGWSPTSDSAATYTRRHVRKKAQQVSLGMQADQVKGIQGDE